MKSHDTAQAPGSRSLRRAHPAQPRGPVVGRFRSLTLDGTDSESGDRLVGRIEAPDDFLAQLSSLGLGGGRPPQPGERGAFRVRGRPARRPSRGRGGL